MRADTRTPEPGRDTATSLPTSAPGRAAGVSASSFAWSSALVWYRSRSRSWRLL